MILLLEVLAVLAVVFGVAVVLTGRAEGLSEEHPDRAATGIPRDRPMTSDDVVGLRFALAFRGYRMDEVDDALDRLAAEIAARDEAIDRLRHPQPAPAAHAEPAADEPAEEDEYVPSDATGEVEPGTPVDVPTTPAAWSALDPEVPVETLADTPEFVEPANPFRPEVPEIKTYDPWSVTPRSRYTDGPTYVEVEHADDDAHVDAVTEHQTGYAPVPDDATGGGGTPGDAAPTPPWQGAAAAAATSPEPPAAAPEAADPDDTVAMPAWQAAPSTNDDDEDATQ